MTTTVDEHADHYVVSPPPSGWRRYLLSPGWIRAIWMTALFFGLGLLLVIGIRELAGWHPIFFWEASAEA